MLNLKTQKFRAYIKKTNNILDVVEISYYNQTIRCVVGGEYENPANGEIEQDYEFPVFGFAEVELMCPTGFKDKRGEEIYEEDIVSYRTITIHGQGKETATVNFNKSRGAYVIRWVEEGYSLCTELAGMIACNEIEIIGNKLKNPELLGESK